MSERARKHLAELQAVAEAGERAVIFFCVFHEGINEVQPARDIDPKYCAALEAALAAGVEAMAWRARLSPTGVHLEARNSVPPGDCRMILSDNQLCGLDDSHIRYVGGIGLAPACWEALARLSLAAKQAGFDIQVASGFRSFERQLAIWTCQGDR